MPFDEQRLSLARPTDRWWLGPLAILMIAVVAVVWEPYPSTQIEEGDQADLAQAEMAYERARADMVALVHSPQVELVWQRHTAPERAPLVQLRQFARQCVLTGLCEEGPFWLSPQEAQQLVNADQVPEHLAFMAGSLGGFWHEVESLERVERAHADLDAAMDRTDAALTARDAARAQLVPKPDVSGQLLWWLRALAVGGLGALGALLFGWFVRRPVPVRITAHHLELGEQRIALDELVRVERRGSRVVLHLTAQRSVYTPHLDERSTIELAGLLSDRVPSLEERKEAARNRVQMARQLGALRQ